MTERFSLGASPIVGFMLDWLDDTYQQVVVEGALTAARDRGLRLVCFVGGALQGGSEGPRQSVFDLVGPESVDALILLGGALGGAVGRETLAAYVARYRGLPMVSIAAQVFDGVPTITVDNEAGMRRAAAHLVSDHGHRVLAFIAGPDTNSEAEARLAAFRQVLAENGVALEGSMIVPGDFSPASGAAAVELLLGKRGVKPEELQAIACANDSMALGALGELSRRGLRVPEQIALLGFDDVEEARYANPPLSTVRQPLREQGREAVRLALALLRGEQAADVVLRAELVKRRSCGCFAHEQPSLAPAPAPARHGFEASLIERRQALLAGLARTSQGRFGALSADWETRLVNALVESVRGESGRFVELCDEMVRQLSDAGVDLGVFHEIVSFLRRELLPAAGADLERRVLTEALFDEARRLCAQASEQREARGRLAALRYGTDYLLAASALTQSFSLSWLNEGGLAGLRGIGIRQALVARCLDQDALNPLIEVTASTPGLLPRGQQWRARDLVRRLAAACDGLCVCPLFGDHGRYGFVVLELGLQRGFGYESLRALISAAAEGQELRRRLSELETTRR